eukprot:gb/GECG01013108.1/.p1 GENE.gb/GECG01013108.1/~~gb/GECG01013108.1/.p1  ORF type:complete len:528 (+),score=48.61 gb/GECG01013108.1/:1-1584(+)
MWWKLWQKWMSPTSAWFMLAASTVCSLSSVVHVEAGVLFEDNFQNLDNWSDGSMYTNSDTNANAKCDGQSNSMEIDEDATDKVDVTVHKLEPAEYISSLSFYYYEWENSNGGGIRLADDDGNMILGVATNNPQFYVHDRDVQEELWPGFSTNSWYERWIFVSVTINWDDSTFDVIWYDGGNDAPMLQETHNRPLMGTNKVGEVKWSNYAGDGWTDVTSMKMRICALKYESECESGNMFTLGSGCKKCPKGYFSNRGESCKRCSSGKYSDSKGSSSCKSCGKGQETDSGRTTCGACPPGKFSSGESACEDCPPGQMSKEGKSQCIVATQTPTTSSTAYRTISPSASSTVSSTARLSNSPSAANSRTVATSSSATPSCRGSLSSSSSGTSSVSGSSITIPMVSTSPTIASSPSPSLASSSTPLRRTSPPVSLITIAQSPCSLEPEQEQIQTPHNASNNTVPSVEPTTALRSVTPSASLRNGTTGAESNEWESSSGTTRTQGPRLYLLPLTSCRGDIRMRRVRRRDQNPF